MPLAPQIIKALMFEPLPGRSSLVMDLATDPATVFLNQRTFTEYSRRVAAVTARFKANPADW